MALKIDELTNDIKLTNGKFEEVSGLAFVGQRVKDHLFTFTNEWFLDLFFGVPYLTDILGQKNANFAAIGAFLKSAIREAAGDEATLTAFQLTHDTATRELKASFLLVDSAGEVTEQSLIL